MGPDDVLKTLQQLSEASDKAYSSSVCILDSLCCSQSVSIRVLFESQKQDLLALLSVVLLNPLLLDVSSSAEMSGALCRRQVARSVAKHNSVFCKDILLGILSAFLEDPTQQAQQY